MTQSMTQAYQQAPWRIQLQRIGLFMLVLVMVALVAGLYLYISAKTVEAGVQIQDLEWEREKTLRRISNMKSNLAFITSAAQMEGRAAALGFEPIGEDSMIYMVIPGYPGRQTAIMAPPPAPVKINPPVIKPSYKQSLWEWLFQGIITVTENTRGMQP